MLLNSTLGLVVSLRVFGCDEGWADMDDTSFGITFSVYLVALSPFLPSLEIAHFSCWICYFTSFSCPVILIGKHQDYQGQLSCYVYEKKPF